MKDVKYEVAKCIDGEWKTPEEIRLETGITEKDALRAALELEAEDAFRLVVVHYYDGVAEAILIGDPEKLHPGPGRPSPQEVERIKHEKRMGTWRR